MERMFDELFEVDWASTSHAYGPAEEVPGLLLALRSADEAQREKALSRFYSAVHHQGDVYPCTTASLPFLFELAEDAATPGRGEIVELLVSIGTSAIERCGNEWDAPEEAIWFGPSGEQYTGLQGTAGAVMALRERAEVLVAFASDADPDVRRAAIPALGLFVADGNRAASVLRDRLIAEPGAVERLLVMEAMTTLALRQRQVRADAMAWFAELAADPAVDPETRLAAIIQQVRCAPRQVGEDAVPFAISMLREAAEAPAPDGVTWDQALDSAAADPGHGAPPQVLAAFEHLDRVNRVHAPTTRVLCGFQEALEWRVAERTALLAEQLRCPHPGARTDALRDELRTDAVLAR
jgi:hypothetical protein